MSLYALPVSISDLIQLQLGTEFFSGDTSVAALEVEFINSQSSTVYSYAQQLLANNISFSQVATAVDSLMFGVTDNVSELAKLATQFLPPQVTHAVADGFNPTVYAAEVCGLALAGGNGTSNAFAADFSSLSVSQFASEVASLTGVNSTAIQGFAQNWENFYTANPSATFGLSVTLASYGAAFGDAVGVALLNPSVNGSLALLDSEVQNALIDNAEGLYQVGIPLSEEQPHNPLQGEAFSIPDAGGGTLGPTIDWATQVGTDPYGQFVYPPQVGPLTITEAPSTFTLNIGHYGVIFPTNNVISAAGNGNLLTLILGDSTSPENFGGVTVDGYQTVNIVVVNSSDGVHNSFVDNPPAGSNANVVISGVSGSGTQELDLAPLGSVSLGAAGTITDDGVRLSIGATSADTIDASHAPFLSMNAPADPAGNASGVTVLGGTYGTEPGGEPVFLQGSLGSVNTVTFSNGSTGVVASNYVGADNITSNAAIGGDTIFGDGGPDTITLAASHTGADAILFGEDLVGYSNEVLAISNGSDVGYLGSWGETATGTAIPSLFSGNTTGGTSADMTTISGFNAGAGGDVLDFTVAAWNGASAGFLDLADPKGDLVVLDGGFVVPPGAAQLSPVWVGSGSNGSLAAGDNVLLYAPSGVTETTAQQLAAQLHTSSGAITLAGNGYVPAGHDVHILIAYDASFVAHVGHFVIPVTQTNIADVDLVNTTGSDQSSTANLNVYASDMVNLQGVALTSLTSANIHFI
jgi:hypothetical protein